MKKLFLKTMLLLCALVGSIPSVWAQSDYSANFTGNITLSTSGGSNASACLVKVNSGDAGYAGIKAGTSSKVGAVKIAVPSGTKYLHLHVAGWNGETVSLAVTPTGYSTNISLTSDSGISGSSPFTLNASSKATTDYYKVITFSSALTAPTDLTFTASSGKRFVIWGVTAEANAAGTTAAPSISGNTPFMGNTSVTITNDATADGASIYYTLDGSDPTTTTSATCLEYTAPFSIDATTTVKAIAKKSTDTNASSVVEKTFTKITPLTVADALTSINALAKNGTIDNQYVHGIVVSIESVAPDEGKLKYYISDDGTANNQLYVYKGKGLNNADFTATSELKVGDEVIVFGQLKNYNGNTPEILDSYLISQATKPAPTFSLDITEKSLDAYTHETVDVTLTTNTDGVISCESSNEDVATVALKSAGVYTITAQSEGTATITIKSATSANYSPASATVAITVTDNRADAGISFDETEIEKTWGDNFTGQELNNTNSLAVTYSSTDETVATVSSTGVVTMLKAGTTTIKATFAGNATHKAAVASYDLTINKAAAGLSYAETAFDIPLNDNSFVAPTLNNPHNLAVTYTSSDNNIAVVDEHTGELLLETSATGSVTITAYYTEDDWYKGGNAKYTITIYDPNAKGTKVNPYTVAEAQDLTENLSDVYITGYIVGCVYNNKCYKTTTASLVNTNILLADTPDKSFTEGGQISNESGLCPVELPTSPATLREKWGLKDNNVLGYKVICKGTEQAYFGKRGMKSTKEISAVAVPVTVTAVGLATFVNDNKLDFTNVENLEAYIAKENGSKIELTKVEKVAAGTGVLLRALNDATTFEVPVTTDDADDATGNLFVRGTGAAVATTDATYTNYILSTKGGVVGFYHANNNIVAVNRAYLHTSVSAARIDLSFDELTGINEVKNEKNAVEGIFDLQGRKVVTPSKGLYIVNGKKVVIK